MPFAKFINTIAAVSGSDRKRYGLYCSIRPYLHITRNGGPIM